MTTNVSMNKYNAQKHAINENTQVNLFFTVLIQLVDILYIF